MVLFYAETILLMFLIVSLFGYAFVVIKEKINLRNNTIVIDKKSVTQDHIDETDVKEFVLGGIEVKSGDEIKVTLYNNEKVEGIVIGAKKKESLIVLVTYEDEIEQYKIEKIKELRVISKYGRFFKAF